MQGCFAEPINCFPRERQLYFDAKWTVHTDYVKFGMAPKDWPNDYSVLFRVTKQPNHTLMTPNAHFYGTEAFGFFIVNVAKYIGYMRVQDVPKKHRERSMAFVLCTRTAETLPEISPDQFYPSSKPWLCPVNLQTFLHAKINDVLYLSPDLERVEIEKTKPTEWIYTMANRHPPPPQQQSHDITFLVHTKVRQSKHVKYGLVGFKMLPKIIQSPLNRDAGYHTAPGPSLSEKCLPGIEQKELFFKTAQKVKEHEDFYLGNHAVRISRITQGGFYAHRLLLH